LGTAFGIATGQLATAAHVVGHSDDALVGVLPQSSSPSAYQDTTNNQIQTVPLKLHAFDPVRDIAVLACEGLTMASQSPLGSTDDTPPGAPVVTHGFPHADTGRLVLTQHAALVGARVLLGTAGAKTKHIVLNIQTRPGQSGSPVMANNIICAMVIGAYRPAGGSGIILGNIDPATLHQTTHAVSAEYIKGML
jgi:S1-C subfamily serine protease